MEALVVCTANQCRSPMTAALLAAHVARRSADVVVRSAGELRGGDIPDPIGKATPRVRVDGSRAGRLDVLTQDVLSLLLDG